MLFLNFTYFVTESEMKLTAIHLITGVRTVRVKVTSEVSADTKSRCLASNLILTTLAVTLVTEIWAIGFAIAHSSLWHTLAIATREVSVTAITTHCKVLQIYQMM